MATKDFYWIGTLEFKKKKERKKKNIGSGYQLVECVKPTPCNTWSWFPTCNRAAGDPPSPLSTMIRGISFSAGEEHLIRFPSTKPFISARSSKVQLTPAESSGTLWASNTNWLKKTKTKKQLLIQLQIPTSENPLKLFIDKTYPAWVWSDNR